MSATEPLAPPRLSLAALFLKFLRFGCLAFGGPVAHIANIGWLAVAVNAALVGVFVELWHVGRSREVRPPVVAATPASAAVPRNIRLFCMADSS